MRPGISLKHDPTHNMYQVQPERVPLAGAFRSRGQPSFAWCRSKKETQDTTNRIIHIVCTPAVYTVVCSFAQQAFYGSQNINCRYILKNPFVCLFRFVVFRLFLVRSPSIFFPLPCSPWWRILFFCLDATPPSRCLRACKSAYSPYNMCCLISCVLALFFFSPFLDFDLDVV